MTKKGSNYVCIQVNIPKELHETFKMLYPFRGAQSMFVTWCLRTLVDTIRRGGTKDDARKLIREESLRDVRSGVAFGNTDLGDYDLTRAEGKDDKAKG